MQNLTEKKINRFFQIPVYYSRHSWIRYSLVIGKDNDSIPVHLKTAGERELVFIRYHLQPPHHLSKIRPAARWYLRCFSECDWLLYKYVSIISAVRSIRTLQVRNTSEIRNKEVIAEGSSVKIEKSSRNFTGMGIGKKWKESPRCGFSDGSVRLEKFIGSEATASTGKISK